MKRIFLSITAIFYCVCFMSGATGQRESYSQQLEFGAHTSKKEVRWITAWTAAPDSPGPSLKTQTIRQIVRTSIAGSKIRVRLSNLFGSGPLNIGPVRVAKHDTRSTIKNGTESAVTFGGKPTVTIAKGADALSDPVVFPVTALEQIAVSLYLPAGAESSTIHSTAIQTAFIASGDATGTAVFPQGETDTSRFFLTDVEVSAKPHTRTLVIVGDSITDGVGSTEDGNTRWPDALAERLQADAALSHIGIANSGISGNRILNDGAEPYLGPSVLKRFERDALNKPGVHWILMFSGGNDISARRLLETPKDIVSAQQIINGIETLIKRARQKGIKVFGATLTPKEGSKRFYYAEGETMRQEINSWIRTSGAFDAVVDFDKVIRDPENPKRMLPDFDSGDHVHPNDAGYKAMAASIDLNLFMRKSF
jgi:lysophospholipase L1-like esterase